MKNTTSQTSSCHSRGRGNPVDNTKNINTLITENLDTWTTAIKSKSRTGRGSNKTYELYGITKLRALILDLAVRGLLVPQDQNNEPASVLLEKIKTEKEQLLKEGKIRKQKPLPDISEEEKPFDLPDGWLFKRLGNLAHVFSGNSFKSQSFIKVDGAKVIKITNVGVGKLIETNDYLPECFLKDFEGDLILALTRPYISTGLKVSICPKSYHNSLLNQRVAAIRTFTQNNFLYNYMQSHYVLGLYQARFGNSGLQPNLKMGDVTDLIIPVPPFEEQKRIVAKVDELMTLCDQLEQQTDTSIKAHKLLVENLLNALTQAKDHKTFQQAWQRIAKHFDTLFTTEHSIDQLKQTILQLAVMGKLVPQNPNDEPASELLKKIAKEKAQLIKQGKIKKQKPLPEISEEEKPFELEVNWSFAYMANLCSLITDGTHQTPKYTETGRPFISAKCVKPFIFMPEKCRFVSEEDYQNYIKNRKPEFKDILLSRVGAGIGQAAIIDVDLEFAIYVSTGLLKPHKNQVLSEYILIWLNSPIGKGYSERNTLGKGVSQGNLNLSLIRNFVVSLPPMKEQKRIVAKVDELIALCDQMKSQITSSKTIQTKIADSLTQL